MSITNPTQSDISLAMKAHAKALIKKAERLAEYAEGLGSMDEAEFMAHLGNEYSGPGFMRQMQEEVFKASEVRPSDTFQIDHAMTEVFAKAQRQQASQS